MILEGDAKVFETIQALKKEYGGDLQRLIPYPGDWHLLKNYQLCFMKPFFGGRTEGPGNIANTYPPVSIQNYQV